MDKINKTTKLISSIRLGEYVIIEPEEILEHVVHHSQNIFHSNLVMHDQLFMDEVIPWLVGNRTNNLLTLLPSHKEIQSDVFYLNKYDVLGFDGFGAFFFQIYWNIIH